MRSRWPVALASTTLAGVTAFSLLLGCAPRAWAQPAAADSRPATAAASTEWAFSASVYTYFLPDDTYGQPTFTGDRDWLHLEARYNYESLDTGSMWLGLNFGGGETWVWELTTMVGGVFGDTDGLAPGYKGSLAWKRFLFYSEGEYVFDTGEPADSFFFNWSELSFSPLEWLRFGLVTQRTRVYQTDRDLQRGLLVGATYGLLDVTAYVLNPDSDATIVMAAVVNW